MRTLTRTLPALLLALTVLLLPVHAAQTPAPAEGWTAFRSIAHCLGEVDGAIYTNSKEAFEASYARGIRVFEADFAVASDGVLVVRHDFEENSATNLGQPDLVGRVTSAQHLSTPILNKYTALDAQDLLELLRDHPDAWLVTDTKDTDPDTVRQMFAKLVRAARNAGGVEVLDRVIVQLYDTTQKDIVAECWPFRHWLLTTYLLPEGSDYSALARWCAESGVDVLTMPAVRATPERVAAVTAQGVKVYVHTLNDKEAVAAALESGVYGVYSDTLTPMEVARLDVDAKIASARELFSAATVKLLGASGSTP